MSEPTQTPPTRGDSFDDVSPPCPWCGDELTDSPSMDLPVNDSNVIECGGCGKPVEVEGWTSITWKARKATTDADPKETDQ